MRIAIIGSMQFSDKMLEFKHKLLGLGYETSVSEFVDSMLGKTAEEQEKLKIQQKNNDDAIKKDCQRLENADAVLVLNFNKDGVQNYIGGNTFLEVGYAHILNKKIFLLNPVPNISFYNTELEAFKPIILNGDFS